MEYLHAVQDLYHELGELRGLEAELAKLKVSSESFQERYNSMVRTELILGLNKIRDKYLSALIGTPEAEYLNNLLLQYSGKIYNPNSELLDKEIEFLDLTVRSRNSLMAAQFYHVGQVAQMKESYLSKFPNVGRQSVRNIKEALEKKELTLDMNLDYKVSSNSKLFDLEIIYLNDSSLVFPGNSLLDFFKSINIQFLGELVQYDEKDFSNLHRSDLYSLKNYLENRSMSFGMQIPRYSIAK